MSLVLWGPPGTGKTTLAYVVSQVTSRRFTELSAVTAGVKDVRAAVDAARRELGMSGRQTVLFIDEVHRFTKTQQDALLPAVENRWVSFIGATTENPSFSVVSPLLSRSLLLTLQPLDDDDVRMLIDARPGRRARPRRRPSRSTTTRSTTWSGWRAATAGARSPTWRRPRSAADARQSTSTRRWSARSTGPPVRYDRDGDQHYDVISAFIKIDAGQRRRRRAALPGPDDRGRGGPAVHRPAADRARQRGRRDGRPDRAADRRSPPRRRSSSSGCPRPGSTWPRR